MAREAEGEEGGRQEEIETDKTERERDGALETETNSRSN